MIDQRRESQTSTTAVMGGAFSSPPYHHIFERNTSRSRRIAIAMVRGNGDRCANQRGTHDDLFSATARRVGFAIPPLSVVDIDPEPTVYKFATAQVVFTAPLQITLADFAKNLGG